LLAAEADSQPWLSLVGLLLFWPKQPKSSNLMDTLGVGVERIRRDFEPVERQAEDLHKTQSSDEHAKT